MFLFSRLRSLVERIKRFECWAEGTTNGVIIDRSEVDWLIELGYDQLVFSIDGVEPATMQRLRGGRSEQDLERFGVHSGPKTAQNVSKPQIVVGFVAQIRTSESFRTWFASWPPSTSASWPWPSAAPQKTGSRRG